MDSIKLDDVNYKILLVGTGATGSQLLPFLCQLLNNYCETNKHKLYIMDGDFFEKKNLKNQKCTINNIGYNKAQVLCKRYQSVYPNIDISYIPDYLKDINYIVNNIVDRYSFLIIIGCVDNEPTRIKLNELFYNDNIRRCIYIDSGNGTKNREGQIVIGYKNYCKEYNKLLESGYVNNAICKKLNNDIILEPVCSVFPQILKNKDSIDKHVGCGAIVDKYPQNIATNVMAASLLFSVVNNIISDNVINNHVIFFNAENCEVIRR